MFKSKIFILPGLGNSGDLHWQTLWEKKFPQFIRINQRDWDTPVCDHWVETIHDSIRSCNPHEVILVGHSLACSTIVNWSKRYSQKIKGALLVAPSDTEAETYPSGTLGFKPMPLVTLPFKSIVVASSNDFYVTKERANFFAQRWGSELVNIDEAGHINAASNLGEWPFGLELLKRLDQ